MHENAYIWKSFTLEFINNFASLFYIAFAKQWAGPELAAWLAAEDRGLTDAERRSTQCFHNNCLYELGIQLAMTMFVRSVLARIAWLGISVFRLWTKSVKGFGAGARDKAARAGGVSLLVQRGLRRLQHECHLQSYNDVTKEYQEVAIMYGYIVLFAAAFPAAPILALFVLQVELRTDAYKICLSKRPPPRRTKGIGHWYLCFEAVTNIAVVTNVGLICFTAKTWIPEGYSTSFRVLAFLAAEHALFMLKFGFQHMVADEASRDLVQMAQHADKFTWLHRVIKYADFGGVLEKKTGMFGRDAWVFPAPDPDKVTPHCTAGTAAFVPPGKGCLSRAEMRGLRLDTLQLAEDRLVRCSLTARPSMAACMRRVSSMAKTASIPLESCDDIFRSVGLAVVDGGEGGEGGGGLHSYAGTKKKARKTRNKYRRPDDMANAYEDDIATAHEEQVLPLAMNLPRADRSAAAPAPAQAEAAGAAPAVVSRNLVPGRKAAKKGGLIVL